MLSFYLLGAKRLFSFLKKALFVITIYFIIIALFINLTSKKIKTNEITLEEKITKINYQIINDNQIKNLPQGNIIIGIYKISNCIFFGQLCSNDSKNQKNNYKNSIFGKINNLFISVISIPPASFLYWSYNSLEKAQFIPQSYAAESTTYTGIGLQAIKAFYKLWENFRNLSFLIITLVLVTIGFMIMFRTKINPQTVISIENALPKIVIAMILITFSYPLAGLIVDIMYISLPIVSGLFNGILDIKVNNFIFDQFVNNSAFSVVFDWYFFGNYLLSVLQILTGGFLIQNLAVQGIIGVIFSLLVAFLVGLIYKPIGDALADILGNVQGDLIIFKVNLAKLFLAILLIPTIAFLLIILIVVLGLLFLSFRIFFFLLSCLFNLIVYIIIAPLYLLLEALPGKSSFSSWIKNIIGNLAVFPVFLFIILLIRAIDQSIILEPEKFFSLPGLTSNTSTSTFLASMINIYIFLMIPDLLKLVKATIIGKEGLSIPASAGILFGGVGAAGGSIMGFANQFYYLKMGYDTFFGKKLPHGGETGKIEPENQQNKLRTMAAESLKKILPHK